jgi:hypothetical protein
MAKHQWQAQPPGEFATRHVCEVCKAVLTVKFGERVEEVEKLAFENYQRRLAGTRGGARTITRAMEQAAIPPDCSRQN